jgi:plasmid stabilization system protein ParE
VKHRLRIAASFRRDLRAQAKWLRRLDQDDWIAALGTALDEAMTLLSEQPRIGAVEARAGRSTLRRLVLRRVPYVVWYGVSPSGGALDVWLLRLFHARQRRPEPHWPRARY